MRKTIGVLVIILLCMGTAASISAEEQRAPAIELDWLGGIVSDLYELAEAVWGIVWEREMGPVGDPIGGGEEYGPVVDPHG